VGNHGDRDHEITRSFGIEAEKRGQGTTQKQNLKAKSMKTNLGA